MLGRYPVTIGSETRGELQVSKDGAVWLFEAEAEDPGGLLRLSVYGEGREGYLGVMSPGRGGRVKLRKRLSRTDLRGFPEKIEYAAPAGQLAVEAKPEPEPEPEEPQQTPGGGETLWYSAPDGTLSSFVGTRLLVALPAADPRVPPWAGDCAAAVELSQKTPDSFQMSTWLLMAAGALRAKKVSQGGGCGAAYFDC